MQRRTLIKKLILVSGGALFLPSCLQHDVRSSLIFNKINIDGNHEKLLSELAETLIPADGTPGAKEVSAHLFALTMINDCYKKEEQDQFIAGMKAFEAKTKKQFGKTFIDCNIFEKETFLTDLESGAKDNPDIDYFYTTYKRLIIQGYTTSKYFLTKIQVYELVPGHFYGCVPVKKAS